MSQTTPRPAPPPRRPERAPKGEPKGRTAGSTMVLQRIRDATAFCASIEVHKPKAVAGLAASQAPLLAAGESMPDYALVLDLAARSVAAGLAQLSAVQEGYARQTARCHELRREGDRVAAEELYPRAIDLRQSIDAVFGKPAGVTIHGFRGRTPTWRDGLRDQVGRTLHFLESPLAELPPPIVAGFVPDRDAWIRLIRPPYERLDSLLDELTVEDGERKLHGDARRRALEDFDAVLGQARALAEALFEPAGLDPRAGRNLRSYAERRRLSRRARQRREMRGQSAGEAKTAPPASGAAKRAASTARSPKARLFATVSTWLSGRLRRA